MLTGDNLIGNLSWGVLPYASVERVHGVGRLCARATALAPFALAMPLRAAFGRNKFTSWLISISTMWFLLNALLAPYSPGMREDFQSIQSLLR
jgi:hypothetical protein